MTAQNVQKAFATLQLPLGADLGHAKAAYRRLARQQHPDLNPHNSDEVMVSINQAYSLVCQFLSNSRSKTPRPYMFQDFGTDLIQHSARPKTSEFQIFTADKHKDSCNRFVALAPLPTFDRSLSVVTPGIFHFSN